MSFFGLILFIFFTIVASISIYKTNSSKVGDISIFTDQNIFNNANLLRTDNSTEPKLLNHILYSKYVSFL